MVSIDNPRSFQSLNLVDVVSGCFLRLHAHLVLQQVGVEPADVGACISEAEPAQRSQERDIRCPLSLAISPHSNRSW